MRPFSSAWKSSKSPRKQRKYRLRAPLHLRRRMLAVHLAKDLRQKHRMRSISVRVGDRIKVIKGDFAGSEGKVERVDMKDYRIFITGIERSKKDGTKALVGIAPASMVMIELNTEDQRRLGRSPAQEKKPEKIQIHKEQKG
ncbi:TPA: 50S ribosomal protein L24 [Candidatus Woesearchaeota archaeon]|nr:50S ribosomal protein L24, large subunit ribosomal protein L24 [uncultured archaeon]KHO51224.1 MAG: 50S ribosomal protein L24, large subunit ribosomal protein L24 [archaeon GW2011_AR11]HIH04672.1 50S ribosomal protein L24 [Candidatus Woesearchaeota archaeon]HIH91384.1 50S ribosomal protein L24 [Candidatus Woesearchaeota archaeon]HII64454.1 50S ribosomal protein L24 [Candidatus Woesearchaeota archaeon]